MATHPTTTSTADERALIAAARAGDERAFRTLVEPYRRGLELHCYRMLGSPLDAEDVVQESLLRAWRGLERFERRASVQTWLYRIATNACLDELERRPRLPGPVLPYPDERIAPAAAPIADPAARYAQHEGMELAFLTAIQQLPGRQRAVLILRDVLGWTTTEVADLLESTVASVNSALQRARSTIERDGAAARSPRPHAATQRDLLRRYVDAWERVDMPALVALLREDAVLRMPPRPAVVGRAAIGRFLGSGCTPADERGIRLTPTHANGRPGVVMHTRAAGGALTPHGVLLFEVEGDVIAALDAFIDDALVEAFVR